MQVQWCSGVRREGGEEGRRRQGMVAINILSMELTPRSEFARSHIVLHTV
jgi:hypothetical protein